MADVTVLAERRLGTTLRGKYRLDRVIGVGGMAAVYAGRHVGVGKDVAVKVLHPHVSLSPEMHARFLREGLVANQVDHPGVVRVLDNDSTDDGSAFLIMELLEGETLESLAHAAGGRLSARLVARLARPLLDVLAAAHAKGIVHRDIKPANLFLTREGALKVLDFGIARLEESLGSPTATRTGRTMGTPAFMAPEQALGKQREIDARTDLWAVGATMFSLLAGEYVHESENPQALVVYSGSKRARSVTEVAPDTPPPLAAVIDRALLFDQKERWASAREMARALEEAYAKAFGEPLDATGPVEPPPAGENGVPTRNVSTTMGVAQAGSARAPAASGRRMRWAIGAIGGVLAATTVAAGIRTYALRGQAVQQSSPPVAVRAVETDAGTRDGGGLAFDCRLVSRVNGVGSMAWMRGVLFMLAANPVTETIDLVRLPLDDRMAAADAGAQVVHSYPIHQCTGSGKTRSCGFFDYSAWSPLLPDGERLVFAISFDASACSRGGRKECDWEKTTCGSLWSLDFASSEVHSLSRDEAWIAGIATDGSRLFWTRSYGKACSPSVIRMYQSGTGALTLHPMRPDDEDLDDWPEGGGIVVIGGRLVWLSTGVSRWTDGGFTSSAPSQGALYETPHAFSNAAQEMAPRVVARGLDRPRHLTSDGQAAYFAAMDGNVYKFEGEVLSTLANLGRVDDIPMLATTRTKRGRFVVAATTHELVALTPDGVTVATDDTLGSIRSVAAEPEGQSRTLVAYAASESGVWACEAK